MPHPIPIPNAEAVLADPAASDWLKSALLAAMSRDPVDAANDAAFLAVLLERRAEAALALASVARRAPRPQGGPGAG